MDAWVGYVNLGVNILLAGIVVYFTRKYGKAFETAKKAEIEAKHAEIAAKDAELNAKRAWIDKLESELRHLKELNPETMRKHTIAIKEQLNEHIALLSQEIEKLRDQLQLEQSKGDQQRDALSALETTLADKEIEISKVRKLAEEAGKATFLIPPYMIGITSDYFKDSPSLLSPDYNFEDEIASDKAADSQTGNR